MPWSWSVLLPLSSSVVLPFARLPLISPLPLVSTLAFFSPPALASRKPTFTGPCGNVASGFSGGPPNMPSEIDEQIAAMAPTYVGLKWGMACASLPPRRFHSLGKCTTAQKEKPPGTSARRLPVAFCRLQRLVLGAAGSPVRVNQCRVLGTHAVWVSPPSPRRATHPKRKLPARHFPTEQAGQA